MVKLIRSGVFETNSSSTHSVTIDRKRACFQTIVPNDAGEIVLNPVDFCWEWETYSDPESKLTYLFIYLRDWVADCDDERELFYNNFNEVVLGHTKAKKIIIMGGEEGGCIDHQSVEDEDLHYILRDKSLIKNFIFGKGSFIKTGNDNESAPEGYFDHDE